MAVSRRSMLWIVPGATVAVPLGALLLPREGRAAQVNAEGGIAVRGTDVVAYATQGRPVAGRAEFAHAWRGATWRFASAAHRDLFAADPERYAPAYGGFCAYAVSEGYTAPDRPRRLAHRRWPAVPELRPVGAAPLGTRHPRPHRARGRQLAALGRAIGPRSGPDRTAPHPAERGCVADGRVGERPVPARRQRSPHARHRFAT